MGTIKRILIIDQFSVGLFVEVSSWLFLTDFYFLLNYKIFFNQKFNINKVS